jgi:hypothetical protein
MNIKMKKKQGAIKCKLANMITAVVLCWASGAHAHGTGPGHIYEGPSPGTAITVIIVVSWVIIALGIVFLVRRLIRPTASKQRRKGK